MQSGSTNQNYWRNLKRKSGFGQLVMVLLSLELLLFGSFLSLPLPTATGHNLQNFTHATTIKFVDTLPSNWQAQLYSKLPVLSAPVQPVRYSSYVPIVPLAVLAGYVLGMPLAPVAAICWLAFGLVGPLAGTFLFASGGGVDYWREPGFGYLVGLVGASWFAGRMVPEERKSWRQLVAGVGGVLVTHLVGLGWLMGGSIAVLLTEGDSVYYKWQPFLGEQIRNLTWYQLPYDLLFAVLLIALAFPLRWLTGILTAPDIASRQRARQPLENQLELLSETAV